MPLYDRGYDKDPTNVAAEAMRQAQRDGVDVVLVDTAGRMQDNEPLMRALSMLINKNRPDLVLFVGEALVGNDGATRLHDLFLAHAAVCACCGPSVRMLRALESNGITRCCGLFWEYIWPVNTY